MSSTKSPATCSKPRGLCDRPELGMAADVTLHPQADDAELPAECWPRAALEHRSDDTAGGQSRPASTSLSVVSVARSLTPDPPIWRNSLSVEAAAYGAQIWLFCVRGAWSASHGCAESVAERRAVSATPPG
jgi:hypothetical protein